MADTEVTISEDGRSSHYRYGQYVTLSVEQQIRRAYDRMDHDLEKTGALILAWINQDSELRNQIVPQLVAEYVAAAVARLADEEEAAK